MIKRKKIKRREEWKLNFEGFVQLCFNRSLFLLIVFYCLQGMAMACKHYGVYLVSSLETTEDGWTFFFSLSLIFFSFSFFFYNLFLFFSTILFWNYKTENSSSHLLLLSSSSRSIRNDLLGVADAREGSATRWNISSIFSLDFSLFVQLVPPNRISFE